MPFPARSAQGEVAFHSKASRIHHFVFQHAPPLTPEEEVREFTVLQQKLVDRWLKLRDAEGGTRDVVVVPSLSLDEFQLASIPGINAYEERMLFTLGLLRKPRARLVYVTSDPIHPAIIDYFLALIGGIPTAHARERLTLLSAYDSSSRPLTDKVLERPRLLTRIRDAIDHERAHLTVFTVSDRERRLAVRLGIPLYGVNPSLLGLGTKSGSREVFRQAGIPLSPGAENLFGAPALAEAIASLWEEYPDTRRVVVKLNEGFSGEGNAILDLDDRLESVLPGRASHSGRVDLVLERLERDLRFSGKNETWGRFLGEIESIGGVVERYVEGHSKASPSVQLRINPRGDLEAMSTHDQVLGGPDGQLYIGCRFPARTEYRMQIQEDALRVGEVLVSRGVVGRVAVDFVTVENEGKWDRYAIEINLRMTGTTHPIMTMKLLNDGDYDAERGTYVTRRGEERYYVSTDNLIKPQYRGLMPADVLDVAAVHEVHYQPWKETGVVFHLLGAVSQFGKVGFTAIGASPEEAEGWYRRIEAALDAETEGTR